MASPSSPKPTRTANFIALNLEAYEVVSQLIFGQSKIGFAENFLPPNLGDYEVACHTSEAPGLPAFQGRLPSPQDGRVAIRLLPLAGLLLRRTDMLDKVVISWTHCLCSPHPAAMLLWLPLSRLWLAASPLSYPPPCAHGPAIRMGLFLPGLPCSRRHQLQVAKISGKRHDHMLRDIEQFLTQQPEIFVEPNFGEYEAAY